MRKYFSLFLIIFFLFLPILVKGGSVVCDGSFCLEYEQKTSPSELTDGNNYYIFTNDTTNSNPETFFATKLGDYHVKVFNSTWDYQYTITLSSTCSNGHTWFNDTGIEKFVCSFDGYSTDYIRYFFMNGTLDTQKTISDTIGGGCDWYNNKFYCQDDTGTLETYEENFTQISSCSIDDNNPNGIWHFNNESKLIYGSRQYYDTGKHNVLVLIDENCNELGVIEIEDFTEISSVTDITGIVGNQLDTKLYVFDKSAGVYTFKINTNVSETTITPVYPLDNSIIYDNNIVIRLNLETGENGTLNCYLNDTLKYNDTFEKDYDDEVRFDSGQLSSGVYNLFCNYTDIYNNYWTSEITFSIDLGLGAKIGNFWSELLGFKDDSYSTAEEKGLAFFSLLLCIILSLFPILIIAGESKLKIEGSSIGYIFLGLFLSWIFLFTYIGWLPTLIGVVIIMIVLLVLSGMFLKITRAT